MEFQIRATTSQDLAAVDALFARSYPRLLKADYPPSILVTALPIIARARPELLSCGTFYLAQTEAGQVIAAGGWTPDRSLARLGHIRHVVTDDRFLRRGVARALITHTLDVAQNAGCTQMECWSTRTAVAFYSSLGFTALGPIDVPLAAGITFPSVKMKLDLP
ncbi:MAG: GNAT family N-acetyltransferase [Sedimentitalea sp.]